MKAIIMAPYPPPYGGIATWAVNLTNSDLKDNWVTTQVQTNRKDVEIYKGVRKHNAVKEIKRCIWIWRNLIHELRMPDTAIVHTNIPANFLSICREIVSSLITKKYKKQFVVHYHCTLPQIVRDRKTLIALKVLAKISPNVIVLNDQSKSFIEMHTSAKAYLIPNFVNCNIILDEKKVINNEIRTALYVGGIVEDKGCNTIIETAKAFPNIEFRMVGFISDEYAGHTLPDNVIMTGVKSGMELESEYENADVFLFLSHMAAEGFSIALTEAMAHGLPCIVTEWAANRDMIGEVGGITVPINNTEAVISAIDQINQDQSFREIASERNISTVRSMYSNSIVPNMFVDAYEDIIKRNGIK